MEHRIQAVRLTHVNQGYDCFMENLNYEQDISFWVGKTVQNWKVAERDFILINASLLCKLIT